MKAILQEAVDKDASDLHITVGLPPTMRLMGKLTAIGDKALTANDTETLAASLMTQEQEKKLYDTRELDFTYSMGETHRFRVNIYFQRSHMGIAIRMIPSEIPSPEAIELSPEVVDLTRLKNGLVLVTGPTGSGKSTTLAALINYINKNYNKHILTIEDPIEFVYQNEQSIINQREVGSDTLSFSNALKSVLREDPDVILVGEMRDLETITATLTIAETGHLAFATLHTNDVAQTIDRIIDVFPPHQQAQIRMVLSVVLKGIICQQLLPSADGKSRVAAREILFCDPAIGNIIREGKTQQIVSRIQTGGSMGMRTLDADIQRLLEANLITYETAQEYSTLTNF